MLKLDVPLASRLKYVILENINLSILPGLFFSLALFTGFYSRSFSVPTWLLIHLLLAGNALWLRCRANPYVDVLGNHDGRWMERLAEYTLILTEKPDAAARIAVALDKDNQPKKGSFNGVPYYEAFRERKMVVVPALGHLYTVTGEKGVRGGYPVFDYRWVPLYAADRGAGRTRAWLNSIKTLARDADEFVDACDFDVEGSIIGYTILKYACGGKEAKAKRMKYSTLTRDELQAAYSNLLPTLDFNLIEAGLARHEADWLYGINLSRALTQAAKKKSGRYATLSTGRVQGPTLEFVATREKAIRDFVPVPFWTVTATLTIDGSLFEASYERNPIESEEAAKAVVSACKGKIGKIETVESEMLSIPPPVSFDLGSLQNEAYRLFRFSPIFTLKVAQRLYLEALISYPRTSSQKLPPNIGYRNILRGLTKSRDHGKDAIKLLAKPELKPRAGKGFDTAHPAIYPTGNLPGRALNSAERNLWSLVVKRFLSVFCDNALKQTKKAVVNINGNRFLLDGNQTLQEGWQLFYKPYVKTDDNPLPLLLEGQDVAVQKVTLKKESTKAPPNFNPSTLLKKMEQANLGTKATRAGIIQTLYDRTYITGETISITDLGFQIVDVLMKYCPTILSSDLTANLEEKMDAIQEQKQSRQQIISEAIEILKSATAKLKENEDAIGEQLAETLAESRLAEQTIGPCPNCKTGKLLILHSKKTGKRFVGCSNYFKRTCTTAFPLPQDGTLKPLHTPCRSCSFPTIRVSGRGRCSWTLCLNPICPTKKKQ